MPQISSQNKMFTPAFWPEHVRRSSGRGGIRRKRLKTAAIESRGGRHCRGYWSEIAAAAWLILKGYRIIDRRYRGQFGEIDLIAARGNRIAFVEVKYRSSIETAAASISDCQQRRIIDAAEHWVWSHPRYHHSEIGFDAVLVAPGRLPRHAPNALQPHT